MVKRALLLGDQAKAPYHPLSSIRDALPGILGQGFALDITENYDYMLREHLRGGELEEFEEDPYELLISYADCWDRPVTDEQAEGLLEFVRSGGGLLVIHNGISLCGNGKLLPLIGARFTGHPPFQPLELAVPPDSGILDNREIFALEDEPYRFEFHETPEQKGRVRLLEYAHDGAIWQAGWAHGFGLGRVAYLMPGHRSEAFEQPAYRSMIRSVASWLVGG